MRVTIRDLKQMKKRGEKIAMLTAYDYTAATLVEEADGWKRTNALAADETRDLVRAAFRLGEMTARP